MMWIFSGSLLKIFAVKYSIEDARVSQNFPDDLVLSMLQLIKLLQSACKNSTFVLYRLYARLYEMNLIIFTLIQVIRWRKSVDSMIDTS